MYLARIIGGMCFPISKNMINFGWPCLLFIMFLCTPSNANSNSVRIDGQSFYGTWVVDGIRIDEGSEGPQQHDIGDKNYIGKYITIQPNSIKSNLGYHNQTESIDCGKPHYTNMALPLEELLRGTLWWRNDPLSPPKPQDYGLQSATTTPAAVLAVMCRGGSIGANYAPPTIPFPANAGWIARIDDGHLAVRWYDDSMLILARPGDQAAAAERERLLHWQPALYPQPVPAIANSDFYGTWVVDDIRIDRRARPSQIFQLHNKNYIGKTFTITPDALITNLYLTNSTTAPDCDRPHYTKTAMTFADVLRSKLAWRRKHAHIPSPGDYELQSVTSAPIEIIVVTCRNGGVFATDYLPGAYHPGHTGWLARIDRRHLAVHWVDDTLLILSRPDDRQAAAERERLLHSQPN